ncbi:MAG: GGDEF domain-containing protein [Actinomycetota bacterium]|nr:GGDEF domain-containing protein [Actinomycetota bacterium]MDI6821352.1 GGDEF domain-containing protein [Actinomycetota bacterium]
MRPAIRLRYLLLVFISLAFVSLLIYYTRELQLYWYLYIIPIFIAALTFDVVGAIVTGLLSIGLMALWLYREVSLGLITGNLVNLIYEISLGTFIFFVSGIIFGFLSAKQKAQQALLERLSIHDKLTGLYNYSYFIDRLNEEVKRADRFGMPLSLIMIDIDHFKEFNDTFGHVKGNKLLNRLAKIIRRRLRDIDIVARYGGEEFAVLLPGVAKEAGIVAERIRKAVEAEEFEGDVENPRVKKTISAGVAIYPYNAGDDTELIVNADQALYSAKESGRNRVCIYSRESVPKEQVRED